MELKGTIKKIGEIQTFASGFLKREVVILTEEQYPQPISIEFLQDKTDLADAHKEGDSVTIGINLRGREWTSPTGEVKYFNSITGWKIVKSDTDNAPKNQDDAPRTTKKEVFAEEDDDLPF